MWAFGWFIVMAAGDSRVGFMRQVLIEQCAELKGGWSADVLRSETIAPLPLLRLAARSGRR